MSFLEAFGVGSVMMIVLLSLYVWHSGRQERNAKNKLQNSTEEER